MADTNPKDRSLNRGRLVTVLIVAALFAVGAWQTLSGARGYVTVAMDQAHLGVCGTNGETTLVALDAITEVRLTDSLPSGTCLEGKQTGNTVSGVYSNETLGTYTMHAYSDVPACILVTYPEGLLVFNCDSVSRTEELYASLTEATAR